MYGDERLLRFDLHARLDGRARAHNARVCARVRVEVCRRDSFVRLSLFRASTPDRRKLYRSTRRHVNSRPKRRTKGGLITPRLVTRSDRDGYTSEDRTV